MGSKKLVEMDEKLKKEFIHIFDDVQRSTVCHQKYVKVLRDIYKKVPFDRFITIFMKFLSKIMRHNVNNYSAYTKKILSFVSKFCAEVTKFENQGTDDHVFLTTVMEDVLKWSGVDIYDVRYNCCNFIAMVLQDIGDDANLDVDFIDALQESILERMLENKIAIRLVAMSALVRLQDPPNPECPVIQAYIQALASGSAIIRRDATDKIAPNMQTLSFIKDRVRDTDLNVRTMAFQRCADIGPLPFKIQYKHEILMSGFNETNEKIKNKFLTYLLPAWLTAYEGNYLKFIKGLRMAACDEDIDTMIYLCTNLIESFYNNNPIEELVTTLPINENKLIDVGNLNIETTLFWSILTNLLRKEKDMDEFLSRILPDIPPFCNYLNSFIKTKSSEKMDEWEYFDYQFTLLNLFEIADNYDFTDEVGRRIMYSLTISVLQNNNFNLKLTKKIVSIAEKCSSSIEMFTNDMCQLISDIREPLEERAMSEKEQRERDFKISAVLVKINVLKENQEEAIQKRNYKKAQELDVELQNYIRQKEILQNQENLEKIRVKKTDNETLCRCLDILSSVLELDRVLSMTPSLLSCKDNFLIPSISNQSIEVHWRVLKCLTLFSLIDKVTAREYAKVVCFPVASYRSMPVNNNMALMTSIRSITKLITTYGVNIIADEYDVTTRSINATTSDSNSTKRKLYTNDTEDDVRSNTRFENITVTSIFESFLDFLDDENEEIRHLSTLAIASLVKSSFPVTSNILSRIILKWYNPLTGQDPPLQVYLGLLIEDITEMKNSVEIIKEAIIPTLISITRAPKTSPLVDIDTDNVVQLFSQMMNVRCSKDDLKILAMDICMHMSEKPNNRIIPLLIKFLTHLDLKPSGSEDIVELIDRAERVLENIREKLPRKNLEKLITKLRLLQANSTINETNQTAQTTANETETPSPQETTYNDRNLMKEPQQVKRRKNRPSKECVVVLEKMTLDNTKWNDTTLHTIVEESIQMEVDEDLNIDDSSSPSSKTSATRSNSVVLTETSDSDNSSEVRCRKSTRCRKKRIL